MSRFFSLIFILSATMMVFPACTTTKVAYFKNVQDTSFVSHNNKIETPIKPNDILSVTVSSLNAEASVPFNTLNNNVSRATTVTGSNTESGGYLVNADGKIDLPILGSIQASGLTKDELKESITNMILSRKLLIDPIVDIRFLNFEVTVIGEVARPTVITVPSEKISLIKAIGLAGDLTIYGKRDNVLLIREENGKKITRHINLNDADFFNSPYYYLKPNDVIYVEPNKIKAASAVRSPQFFSIILGVLSLSVIVADRLLRN